ncbi:MAG: amino acid permease [Myxococcales bacterium]|nr:amino acid permease [Myxococcales bacterium]
MSEETRGNQFGTFGGVFTPSILTILGVILFMRSGYVTGQAGILSATLILGLATLITFITGLSISAIATNTRVKGGGAYFLISRSLGPEFGGSIGLALFLAQALAVPFYILGFVEALTTTFPQATPFFLPIGLATLVVLFVINYVGADWAIKAQYVVLSILTLSIGAFLVGGLMDFDIEIARQNWQPAYTEGANFWVIFAVFFPAVTGIDAGVNMSGDLKTPERSIPSGTLAAIVVGSLVYLLNIIASAGSAPREALIGDPFGTLLGQAGGVSFLVVAGVFAATLSSAIGSLLGAPRILQALARDAIFPGLGFFAKGTPETDEPRRGLWLTLVMGTVVLLLAGSGGGGGALNAVAVVLTMFFLFAYGMTNAAAFVEKVSRNPSFRPRFKLYHGSMGLIGGVGCVAAAVLINATAALVSLALVTGVFLYISRRVLKTSFGDARRGFYFERVRANLHALSTFPQDPKNWRPTTLALSGNPKTRLALMWYATWMSSGRGIVSMVNVIEGELNDDTVQQRDQVKQQLESFLASKEIEAYVEVIVSASFDHALSDLLQAQSIGPLKPNMVVSGWPKEPRDFHKFAKQLRVTHALGLSQVILVDHGLPVRPRRIDIWWRGRRNGSLMVILGYLLTHNWLWSQARIRLIRMVEEDETEEETRAKLEALGDSGRMDVDVLIVPCGDFEEALAEVSGDSDVVMLGFNPPTDEGAERFHAVYSRFIQPLPTTLIVCSAGHADLLS